MPTQTVQKPARPRQTAGRSNPRPPAPDRAPPDPRLAVNNPDVIDRIGKLNARLGRIGIIGNRAGSTLQLLSDETPTTPENDAIMGWLAQETSDAYEDARYIEENTTRLDDWSRGLRERLALLNAAARCAMSPDFEREERETYCIQQPDAYADFAGMVAEALAKEYGPGGPAGIVDR